MLICIHGSKSHPGTLAPVYLNGHEHRTLRMSPLMSWISRHMISTIS